MTVTVLESEVITPELRRELDHLKTVLRRKALETIPLDPDISDAELVQMARCLLEIQDAWKRQPLQIFGTPETPR